MSIEFFLSSVLKWISLLLFFASLLFVYRGLPDPAAVHFDSIGQPDGFLPKEQLFYVMAGIVLFFNIVVGYLAKAIKKLPLKSVYFQSKGEGMIQTILSYFLNFGLVLLNLYLAYVLRVLLMVNDSRTESMDFSYLGSLGLIFFLIWIIYPFARIFFLPNKNN